MPKKVAILGSTGSIGKSALDVIDKLGDAYSVWGLSANRSDELLAAQAAKFNAEYVSLRDPRALSRIQKHSPGAAAKLLPVDEFELRAAEEADIILVAVVGSAGVSASLAAARAGKRLALANKESLVAAGQLIMTAAAESGAEVIPVDSEHSAVFQALHAGRSSEVSQIVITASGGPFLDKPPEEFASITVAEALNHPTWSMGKKITVDSATMVNKAFEVIEARWLFDMPAERIRVLVHPESIIHSLVEFADLSVMAQLSLPDMRLPIQYALTYPERAVGCFEPLDLAARGTLTFRAPDTKRFPCLDIGFEVAREGGTTGAVFNASNEVAVAAFLDGKAKFTDIERVIRTVLERHTKAPADSLGTIMAVDEWARMEAAECL
jgi:1-deoxy-D-xylulose-5-phosphate reductoisomerase